MSIHVSVAIRLVEYGRRNGAVGVVIARIGEVEIDLDAFEIRQSGEPVRVEPQVFDVLRVCSKTTADW